MMVDELKSTVSVKIYEVDNFCGYVRISLLGTSLAVQWLRFCASNAGGMGSIPGGGTKIPHAACHSQKKKLIK